MSAQILYEIYHSRRRLQSKIIKKEDFTNRTILQILDRYAADKQKIIDIGCGVGSIDLYLASLGKNVLGVDISKNAIKTAKKNARFLQLGKNLKFQVTEFPKQRLKGKYDVVICSEVLEHLRNDRGAVVAIRRLMKPDGILIASSPSLNAPLYKLGFLEKFDEKVGHLRRYSERSFKSLFEKANFEILKIMKTEGILRNYLFTSTIGGISLKVLKRFPFSEIITFVDDITIPIFGESNFYLIARKK